jgi:hypothetical protein
LYLFNVSRVFRMCEDAFTDRIGQAVPTISRGIILDAAVEQAAVPLAGLCTDPNRPGSACAAGGMRNG